MNNESNKSPALVAVIAIVALIAGGIGIFTGGGSGEVSAKVESLAAQTQTLEGAVLSLMKAGALSSPDLGPWFSVGTIVHDGYACDFDFSGDATSTACSIQAPAATTTIVSATIRVATQPYANTWLIHRAATPATETTLLAQNLVGTTGIIAATTTATSLTDGVVLPNSWINFRISTSTAVNANFNATGRVELILREL